MKYEKTQKGNPHQLTVLQHCFPRRSIERFCNSTGRVYVHLIKQKKTVPLEPDAPIFCARRAWDQQAETRLMHPIEIAYQELADRIEAGEVIRRLDDGERRIVSDMYALWNLRWHRKQQPIRDQPVNGVLGLSREVSVDEREILEKHHITSFKTDGERVIALGHQIAGPQLLLDLDGFRDALRNLSWGILKSRVGEFIVPDNSASRLILPISPTLCLTNREGYGVVSVSTLQEMNESSKQESEVFYFGREL